MESNPTLFTDSNVESIKSKILNALSTKNAHADEAAQIFKPYDGQNTGSISFETFYNIVKNTFRK
jgi:Ca2+-binding EF-hand superfamily protein